MEQDTVILEETKEDSLEKTKKKIPVSDKKTDTTGVPNTKKAKLEALDKIIKECDKKFGEHSVIKMGDTSISKIECISTGILGIDDILGGGFPRGRIIEIAGAESSGKTSLCIQAMVECQKNDGVVGFIDAEHALDLEYAKNLGLNIEELYLSQPAYGEQAIDIAESMIDAGIDLLIIDSVAALTPLSEIEGEMGDAQMGKQARLIGQAMRKLTAKIGKNKTCVIFTNQYRSGIGPYASSKVTTGGNALKFFASQRLDLSKGKVDDTGNEDAIKSVVRIKVIKNKIAPPFKKGEFEIIFGKGFSKESDLLSLAVKYDIIQKAGSWYSYNNEKIGQGSERALEWLSENSERFEEIKQKVKEKLTTN